MSVEYGALKYFSGLSQSARRDCGVVIIETELEHALLGHGYCPKCERPVTHCALDEIEIGDRLIGSCFHGVAMCCPHCRTVLGVSADPDILVNDIASRLLHKLSGTEGFSPVPRAKLHRR
jgi:hypothetical protein